MTVEAADALLRAPFPYPGGKSRIADVVWAALGNPRNYIEPFFGSGAVLLARPHAPQIETVNDADGLLANVWRALRRNPAAVARHADHPVNELDLHAWHRLLVTRAREVKARLERDPRWCDVELAGRWVWGASMWIGAGWCAVRETPKRQRPALHENPLPEDALDEAAVHRKMPEVGGLGGRGAHGHRVHDLVAWFETLQRRLRKVRVCCGDFERVLGPAVLATSARARAWCLANGATPRLRIVLAGLGDEHDELLAHGWWSSGWTGASGYARSSGNRHREKLWYSPHCLRADGPLFGGLA